MVLAQVFFTLLYFITEAAFSRGLNPYVYVTSLRPVSSGRSPTSTRSKQDH
jgi:hypothetical protein